jgi:hypothetical protein
MELAAKEGGKEDTKVQKVLDAVDVCQSAAKSFGWTEEHSKWYDRWADSIKQVKSPSPDAMVKEQYHRQLDVREQSKVFPPWKLPTEGDGATQEETEAGVTVPHATTFKHTIEPVFHKKADGSTYSRANRVAAVQAAANQHKQQQGEQIDQLRCQLCNSAEDGDDKHMVLCEYSMAHEKDKVGYHMECVDNLRGRLDTGGSHRLHVSAPFTPIVLHAQMAPGCALNARSRCSNKVINGLSNNAPTSAPTL